MSGIINCEDALSGDEIIGLVEYYDAILSKKDLVASEGEFRTSKLSLTLDFIRAVGGIPADLKADLISAIIGAWRLSVPEKTLGQRKEELDKMRSSISSIRSTIEWARKHPSQMASLQTDVAVMFALPLMPSDLRSEDVPGIHDLLCRVMDYFAALIEGKTSFN